ncbi:transposase [Kitasatospora cineracea]
MDRLGHPLLPGPRPLPRHPRRLHICDNYGTHKTPAIRAWPERHPRFHLHFTPTGSSWINQVERWFGFPGDQMIRRGAHRSVQAPEADIRAWTKSAEEVLEFPARFCQRISGAGH